MLGVFVLGEGVEADNFVVGGEGPEGGFVAEPCTGPAAADADVDDDGVAAVHLFGGVSAAQDASGDAVADEEDGGEVDVEGVGGGGVHHGEESGDGAAEVLGVELGDGEGVGELERDDFGVGGYAAAFEGGEVEGAGAFDDAGDGAVELELVLGGEEAEGLPGGSGGAFGIGPAPGIHCADSMQLGEEDDAAEE